MSPFTHYLCAVFLLIHTGCSNFYDGFKAVEMERCYQLPYPDQQQCLRQIDISYQEYKQQRGEAKKKN